MQWSTCRRWLRNMKKAKDSEIISWNLSYHRSSLNHFLKRSEAIESTWNLAFVTLRVKLINSEIRREFSDLIYRFQKKFKKKVATTTVNGPIWLREPTLCLRKVKQIIFCLWFISSVSGLYLLSLVYIFCLWFISSVSDSYFLCIFCLRFL